MSEVVPMHGKVRCKARSKSSGRPCNNPPMAGQAVCRMHGGATKASRSRAEERIRAAADPAAAKLVELMQDKKVSHTVQLAAARDLLDRAGLSATTTVEVQVPAYEQLLAGASIVVDLPDDEEDVVDAEVVPDMAVEPGRAARPGAQVEEYWSPGDRAGTPGPSSVRDRRGRVKGSAR